MLSFSSTIIQTQTVYPIINFTIKKSWGLQGAAAKTRHMHRHMHPLALVHTFIHNVTHTHMCVNMYSLKAKSTQST